MQGLEKNKYQFALLVLALVILMVALAPALPLLILNFILLGLGAALVYPILCT
jgi:MFS family permease